MKKKDRGLPPPYAAETKDARLAGTFEVLVPVISEEKPTAVCSFNYHQEHFGKVFDIRTDEATVAHTACLGFGLERVTMALFRTHGFDIGKWPSSVVKLMWPTKPA